MKIIDKINRIIYGENVAAIPTAFMAVLYGLMVRVFHIKYNYF